MTLQAQEQQGGDAAPAEDGGQRPPSAQRGGHQQLLGGRLGGGPRRRRLRVAALHAHQTAADGVWREHADSGGTESQPIQRVWSDQFHKTKQKTKPKKLKPDMDHRSCKLKTNLLFFPIWRNLKMYTVGRDLLSMPPKAVTMPPAASNLQSIFSCLANFQIPVYVLSSLLLRLPSVM